MNTHGIQVFDTADDYHVICEIAHNFQFVLFPTKNGLFYQNLMGGRCIEPAFTDIFELRIIEGHAASGTAQSKRRSNNQR